MVSSAALRCANGAILLALAGCGSHSEGEQTRAEQAQAGDVAVAAATPPSRQLIDQPGAQPPPFAASPPDTAADVVFGSNPLMPVSRPALDIMGIRVGASLDEARQMLKHVLAGGYQNYSETVETQRSANATRFLTSLAADKNAENPGHSNQVGAWLVGPPNAPQVWYVGRFQTYPADKAPSYDSTVRTLIAKYGEPSFHGGNRGYSSELYWYYKADGTPGTTGKEWDCRRYLDAMAPAAKSGLNQAAQAGAISGTSSFQLANKACAKGVRAHIELNNGLVKSFALGISDLQIGVTGNLRTAEMLKTEVQNARQRAVDQADQRKPEI